MADKTITTTELQALLERDGTKIALFVSKEAGRGRVDLVSDGRKRTVIVVDRLRGK